MSSHPSSPVDPKKKDFSRQNIRHLRKLQLDTKRKKEECERPAVRTSCSKYDHIPAKVTAYLESHAHSPSPRETTPEADGSGHCAMQDRPISEEQRGKVRSPDHVSACQVPRPHQCMSGPQATSVHGIMVCGLMDDGPMSLWTLAVCGHWLYM